MKIAGIVAEFNPLHYGHKYLIDLVKNEYKMDLVIVAMSPNFVMRGEASIFNKFDRTKHALEAGIDIVAEIPTILTLESADIYASAAIQLLSKLKITDLFFGVESTDETIFDRIVECMETVEYKNILKEMLKKGHSFKDASKKALLNIDESFNEILFSPNNLLAIEYIKSIKKINRKITPHFIKRKDTMYFESINKSTIIQSSSAIREIINSDNCAAYVPYDIEKISKVVKNDCLNFLKYRIFSMTKEEMKDIQGVSEGIEGRIKTIKDFDNYDDLICYLVSKRNRETKINRILMCILLNIKKDEVKNSKIDYIRILGFNKIGQKYLASIKDVDIPIYTSIKKSQPLALYRELDFTKIYSLLANEDILDKEYSPIIFKWV